MLADLHRKKTSVIAHNLIRKSYIATETSAFESV